MSFRQFGGLKYASKHNVVSSNLNASNQLFVTQNVGQPNSIIDFLSDISGNITIYGNIDISGNENINGNLTVDGNETVLGNIDISGNLDISGNATANYMFLSSGTDYATQNNAVMPKSYIDLVAGGINVAGKVYAVSTVAIDLSISQPNLIVDSVSIPQGSYILLVAQSTEVDNGAYLYNTSNYLVRSSITSVLPTGSDAVGSLVLVLNGLLNAKSGWLQTYKDPSTEEAIVGTNTLIFVEFYSLNFKTGNGLITTEVNNTNYISVDPSLNYMYAIDGSSNVLQLGTRATTTGLNFGSQSNQIPISFNGNPYTYSPYSIGSVISPANFTNLSTTSNSAQISFTWNIPSIYTSIPTSLQQLNAVLYANILVNGNNTIKTYPIIQNLQTYLNTLDEIIIAKTNPNNYNNGPINNNTTYFYYNSDFQNIQTDTTNNILILWYTNYGPYPNVSNIIYNVFSEAVPPTADASFNNIPYTTTTTSTSSPNSQLILTYNPPSYLVTSGSSTGVNLVSFTTDLTLLSNSIRYGGAPTPTQSISDITINYSTTYANSQAAVYGNGTSNPTTLYPDCSYNFTNLKSTNSTPATSLANQATFGPYYTAPLQILNTLDPSNNSYNISNYNNPPYLIATTPISGNIYTVSLPSTQVSNVFNNQDISSNSLGPFSINYNQNSRGNLGAGKNLMNIYISIPGSNLSQTDILCNGFPTTNNPQISATSITLSSISAQDQYSATGFTGFYLKIPSFYATIPSSLDASSNQYTFTFSQQYKNTNGSVVVGGTYDASQNFYYDNLGTTSITNNPTITLANTPSANLSYVSGVGIVGNGTINFAVTTQVNNLAHYFYYGPPLTYTFSGGLSNTNIAYETNLANGLNTGNNWTITNSSVTATVNISNSPTFTTTSSVTVLAKSISNTSGVSSSTVTSNQIIYDVPSYSLLSNSTYTPTSINLITSLSSVSYGYRIWSAPDTTQVNSINTTNVVIPPYYSSQGLPSLYYSYSQYPYDKSWNITSTNTNISTPTYPVSGTINTNYEIQIYNGHYGSGDSTDSSGTNGYIKYSDYYNNGNPQPDYSGVSRSSTNYRYATFVWQFTPNNQSTLVNYYNFTFYNVKVDGSPITSIGGSGPPYYINNTSTTRFFLFYRTEQISSGTPYTIPGYSSYPLTSIWVDGNNNAGTTNSSNTATYDNTVLSVSSSNYNTPTDNSTIRYASSIAFSLSGNNLVGKISPIPITYSNANVYIYCRFGLPMNANVTYDYVSLSITSS